LWFSNRETPAVFPPNQPPPPYSENKKGRSFPPKTPGVGQLHCQLLSDDSCFFPLTFLCHPCFPNPVNLGLFQIPGTAGTPGRPPDFWGCNSIRTPYFKSILRFCRSSYPSFFHAASPFFRSVKTTRGNLASPPKRPLMIAPVSLHVSSSGCFFHNSTGQFPPPPFWFLLSERTDENHFYRFCPPTRLTGFLPVGVSTRLSIGSGFFLG